MARCARLRGEGLYHHIYAWGNDRHPLFKVDNHYKAYISFLDLYSRVYSVDIIAYALMQWHVHLFVFDHGNRISSFMRALHGRYAQHYNRMNNRVGHVFGKRFGNKIVQGNIYGMWLSRYIHRQAVEAGIVKHPAEYPWSSFSAYIGKKKKGFLCPEVVLSRFGEGKQAIINYRMFVHSLDSGPINWEEVDSDVIGEVHFAYNNKKNINNELSDVEIIKKLSRDLHTPVELLRRPLGWHQRRVRHRAIMLLRNEYGKSITKISIILDISKAAVVKIVKDS